MSDKEAAEYLEELADYNQEGLLLTPQNNGFDAFWDCALGHAIRALKGYNEDLREVTE